MHELAEQGERGDVTVRVENVGGIEETEVRFGPGVTVLRGRNATNRTSLLSAVAAALGSDAASPKADADAGRVELSVGDETYTRVLERTPDGVRTGGEPYLADPTALDLFAVLLGDNRARRVVERADGEGDLRELLLEPLDTDEIEAEIDRLREERADVESELERLERLEARLPDLEQRRTELRAELEEAREDLERAESRVEAAQPAAGSTDGATSDDAEAAGADADGAQGADADGAQGAGDAVDELEARLADLREARAALEDARYDLETEEESAAELREERADLRASLEDVDPVPEGRLAALDERVDELRGRRSDLESEIGELQSVVQFNEEMLAERAELFASEAAEPTERLLDGERSVDCWTCGSTVAVEAVEATLDHLRDRRERAVEERADLAERIDDLESEREELERRRRRREELADRLTALEDRLADVEGSVEERHAAVREREAAVEELEAEVEELQAAADDRDDLVEHHRRARELAVTVDRLESELADVEDRIEEVESEVQHRRELAERRDAIGDQIRDLRTRVERLEADAVEAFNEHAAELLDALGYDNLERVWIERRAETGRSGGLDAERRRFDLHVVRATDDGRTYEDTVGNLSESEREVIGLVVALAGYLVHDLAASVPVVLLDSLEAVDADRIAALVEHFAEHVEYLLVALLPEDARALDDDYEYVTEV